MDLANHALTIGHRLHHETFSSEVRARVFSGSWIWWMRWGIPGARADLAKCFGWDQTTRGTGGPVPRAPEISSLGRDRGGLGIFKIGTFLQLGCFFRQFNIFTYRLWALLALGALFRKGP